MLLSDHEGARSGQLQRWSTDATTPWYPSMRIYRTPRAYVGDDLRALLDAGWPGRWPTGPGARRA